MSVRDSGSDAVRTTFESPSRYDLLLAAIPSVILLGVLLGYVGAVRPAVGTALAVPLVGYALFVAAPTTSRSRPEN